MITTFKQFLIEARLSHHEYVAKLVDKHASSMTFDHDPHNPHISDVKYDYDNQKHVPQTKEESHAYAKKHTLSDIRHYDPDEKKGTNTEWMINQYKKGHYKHEDLPRVQDQVQKFSNLKHSLPKGEGDLNRYTLNPAKEPKKLSIHTVLAKQAEVDKAHPDGQSFQHKDIEEVQGQHDRSKLRVFEIKSHAAAQAWRGSCGHDDNTGGWCTGWKNPHHYDNYQSKGPLYGIESHEQHPDGHTEMRKYQVHFPTGSFMDKDDREEEPKDMVHKNPELTKVRWNMGDHHGEIHNEEDHLEHRMAFMSDLGKKHQVENDFESDNQHNIEHHFDEHPEHITSHQIGRHVDNHVENGTGTRSILQALKHPAATQDHIDTVWDHHMDNHFSNDSHMYSTSASRHVMDNLVRHTQNPQHVQDYHRFNPSSDDRSYGPHTIAGLRLKKEFGLTPELHPREQNVEGYVRAATAHFHSANEVKNLPNQKLGNELSAYHTEMHDHFMKKARGEE